MAKGLNILICFALAALNLELVKGSQEIITNFSKGFAKALEECKNEINPNEDIMKDLKNYWDEKYDLVNRDFGCIIFCMSKKHDLMDADGKVHHGNAKEFAMTHGADEQTAQQLLDILHDCEKQNTGADSCIVAMEISKCFRTKIHDLKWAPSVEVVLNEILTDV